MEPKRPLDRMQRMDISIKLEDLPDDVLRDRLRSLAGVERKSLAGLLRHLGEAHRRQAAPGWGFPSMFYYCTQELRYSEAGAYKRINAARKALECPAILEMVDRGELTLEGIIILAPHLGGEAAGLLARAKGKTTRALEALVAEIAPRPDVRDFVMRLPERPAPGPSPEEAPVAAPSGAALPPVPPKPVRVETLSPGRMHLGLTISAELWEKIERARALLRHKLPSGRLEFLFDELIERYLKSKDPLRRARHRAARRELAAKSSLFEMPAVPVAVRDAVFLRDGGRCVFVSPDGRLCGAQDGLEADHVTPRALGGSNDAANLRALCRAHNQHCARLLFGPGKVGRHRRVPTGVDGRKPADSRVESS